MKKTHTISTLVIMITGCVLLSNSVSAQTQVKTVHHFTIKKTIIYKRPTAAELAEGKALFTKSDCLTCHKMDVKLVGPAYYDVAKKYAPTEANYELLANKVIKGGSGVWGQVPMAPHPNLTYDDAKKIIKYVLSLKPPKS